MRRRRFHLGRCVFMLVAVCIVSRLLGEFWKSWWSLVLAVSIGFSSSFLLGRWYYPLEEQS